MHLHNLVESKFHRADVHFGLRIFASPTTTTTATTAAAATIITADIYSIDHYHCQGP